MKVTTQRKVTFGILGLAAIAFVVDLCTSSSSTPAAAHEMSVVGKESPKIAYRQAPTASSEAAPVSLEAISTRLGKIAEEQNLDASHAHDAFAPSNQWKPQGEIKGDISTQLASAGKFRQQHKLIGLSIAGRKSLAIVDGKPVRLNESVDGFRLVEVRDREAIFECGAARVQLTISGSVAGATSDNLEIRPARSGQSW